MKTKTTQAPKAKPGKPGRQSSFFQTKKSDGAFFKAQPNVKVGKRESRFETEADQMAEKAVNNEGTARPLFGQISPLVQRKEQEENLQAKAAEEEEVMQTMMEEEEPVQLQPEAEEEEMVQAQMEEEEQVQSKEEEEVQRKEDEEEEALQMQEEEEAVQTQKEEGEEEIQQKEEEEEQLQTKLAPRPLLHRGLDIANAIRLRRGKGQALDTATRQKMENAFQADFGGVRIHTDQDAVRMNRALGAQAFTTGSDVFFNEGKYDPSRRKGQLLLAHELTHTVQQGVVPERATDTPEPVAEPGTDTATPTADSDVLLPITIPAADTTAVADAGESAAGTAPVVSEEEAGASSAPVEEIPVPRTPGEDPNFKALKRKTKKAAADQKTTPTATSLSKNAEAAAPLADNEQKGQAQEGQVGEMEEEEPQLFDAETFKALLLEQIEKILPKNEEEADKFPGSGKMDKVKDNAEQKVASEKEKTGGAIKAATAKEPDPSGVKPRPVADLVPPQAGDKPKSLRAGNTTPPARNTSEVNKPLVDDAKRMDDEMVTNEVTDEQLAKSEEPSFLTALDSKKTAKTNTAEAPIQFRQQEQSVREKHQSQAESKGEKTVSGMFGERKDLLAKASGEQEKNAKDNTSAREAISGEIDRIFLKTQVDVEKVLGPADGSKEGTIDEGVNTRFELAAKYATLRFEAYIRAKMNAYKRERYGAWFDPRGWGKRIKDTVVGMPDEVNKFYVDGRAQYIADMDVALTGIARYIATELGKVKQRISQGRKEVKTFVDGLPKSQQKLATAAVENIEDKFSQLDSAVTSKQDALIDSIAQKYKESLEAVDARIEEMKAANRGLVDKALDAIKGVIETIKKLKQLIMDLLAAIQSLIGVIMADPIGFMKALFAGIKAGFDSFVANIQKHLVVGLFKWLTGSLGPMGITVPENLFSLSGIFDLIMQVLGLTWDFVRKKMVKLITEPVVKAVETGFTVIKKIKEKGIMGLWEEVQEQFSDLKETVIDAVRNMIITQVIQAGIKWLLSLLIPGAGFIKAIIAIKDFIVFFVESAIALIPTLIEAIKAAAAKNFTRISLAVENGLSTLIPLVIGLLAKLLGISNLVQKVQKIIKNIRKRINRAIDKIILRAKKWAKKFVKSAKKKAKKVKDKLVQWWKAKKKFKGGDGKQHKLYFKQKGKTANMMVASDIQTFADFMKHIKSVAKTKDQKTLLKQAETKAAEADKIIQRRTGAATDDATKKNQEEKQKDLQEKLNELSPITAQIFGFADGEQPATEVDFDSTTKEKATVATTMTATVLSKVARKSGDSGSSPTQEKHTLFDKLILRKEGARSYYVRGHMLNDNLHGPGKWYNMTPLSQKGNKAHLKSAEKAVKRAVQSGSVVNYKVEADYGRGDLSVTKAKLKEKGIDEAKHDDIMAIRSAEQHVPTKLTVSATLLVKDNKGKFTKESKVLLSSKPITNEVDTNLKNYEVGKGEGKKNVHLLKSSAEEIARNTGVSLGFVIEIQRVALGMPTISQYDDIKKAIDADAKIAKALKSKMKKAVTAMQEARNVKFKDQSMNPLMLWDAEMNDALEGAKDEGLINLEKEWYNLPVSDQEQLSELPDIMQSLYTYANGVEIRWRSIQDSSQGGRLQFLELEHVFKDGLGQLYDTEDLLEEELIEFFKPFDLVTDEAECGFLHRPGFASESIYYHRTGTSQLYNLDIDFSGYLEMALAARVYYYWPKVLLDIQSGTKGAETVNFKQNMPLVFPEFNWEAFKEKYQSLRLSVKQPYFRPMKRISITNLEHAIRYLEERISQRLTVPEKIAFPDFDISDASDPFFRTIAEMKLSLEEFLILLIALVPHVYPDFFDRVVAKNLKKDNDLPAFGGIKTAEQRTMMPTVSTALFVLAGDDIQKRMDLLALFNHQHPFYQKHILRLEQPRIGESMLNRRIILDDEYTELFTQGYVSPPKFSSSFPAQLLHTEQEWSDLVLPPLVLERIEEIKTWIEQSSTLMEDWGMKRVLKPGYRALFHGPPGTGKTLTASLLGRYTGRDVFRVDLSAVVSKYIGETEKNLSQLFDKAENKNWILFFDEADALFGKRTGVKDAHDRYANQEVSYLLQRVEEFSGLIILASNLKSNLDEAFLRRFNTIIHFPVPDVKERLQLWRKAFPDAVTLEVDLVEVAARYELAGGSIINVVQYACLKSLQRKSNEIRMKDVLQGIRREIEKDGRLFKSLM